MATVLGAGEYVFGENFPLGRYDLIAISGEGLLLIDAQDYKGAWKDQTLVCFGVTKGRARSYYGLSLPEGRRFSVNGDVLFEIRRAETIIVE